MGLFQVVHTFLIVTALLINLTKAVIFQTNDILVISGQYGKPTWRGSLSAPDLANLSPSEIADQVDHLAAVAFNSAWERSDRKIEEKENFVMAALWVPEKQKVYFATQPKGHKLAEFQAIPSTGLTPEDVMPNIHAEIFSYSTASSDGALPGPRSYMGVAGRVFKPRNGRIERIGISGPCSQVCQ